MNRTILILLTALLPLSSVAATPGKSAAQRKEPTSPSKAALKSFQDSKNKFQLSYPGTWLQQTLEKGKDTPALAIFAKPDQTAMVNIMLAQNNSRKSALEFLNQMDQSRKATNLIPEAKRKVTEEVLKKAVADDGATGTYDFPGKKAVRQRTLVLKRKSEVFVVTGTFQKAQEAETGPLIEAIFASFQFHPASGAAPDAK